MLNCIRCGQMLDDYNTNNPFGYKDWCNDCYYKMQSRPTEPKLKSQLEGLKEWINISKLFIKENKNERNKV